MSTSDEGARAVSGGAVLRPRVTDAITEAAFAELAETGYARTSMDAVARRAGVGKAALYRRWRSKQAMLAELIRDKVADALPPTPDTGALRTDLRELFATFRAQLDNPLITRIGAGLLAEAEHDATLAEVLQTGVAEPRRAAACAILRAAVDRGELPSGLEFELGIDLLIAPLAFRMLVLKSPIDDGYLETLTRAVEAALKAASS
ncbi:TetR/AcrR family transcriptional regulator [Amycolatopsis sp., V23-08]|uniref:TetR/AcrR family transcriptional regulator n=1 Tax=Amycolatopsis heterodermiae TaxID=3110235 RepID=A0ABU5R9M0_9PSEU|nr:TetR/AcrR family transcriptional regulator [Amycolatopsis sp., V23-08]MEA5362364.1 TetR/AcrR family transcriptional regulator [Amycolatopsis sp., V23-08]